MAWLRGLGGAIPGKGRAGNGGSEVSFACQLPCRGSSKASSRGGRDVTSNPTIQVEFSPDHIHVKDKKVQAVLNEAFEWERRLEPR